MNQTSPYDIVVAGGGTAGTAAAIAAARPGRRVLIIEESNCLGGISTAGCVGEWFAGITGMGDIFNGITAELTRANCAWGRFFNSEMLKIILQHQMQKSGADILFHTRVTGASVSDGSIKTVHCHNRSGFFEVPAKFVIDTTGEGDLAAYAGASFSKGDPVEGLMLHMTLVFILCDTGKPVTPYLPEGLQAIHSRSELPGLGTGGRLPDGRVYCNATKVMRHDPTDGKSLSDAEAEARMQIARIVHYMQRTSHPTYQLCASGSKIGIREGRRITGEYTLTEKDILAGVTFNDNIAVATSQIDFHSLTEPGHGGRREQVPPYGIPLRALTPKGLKNILTAGKCISGDQVAHSSYRMTPTCCMMGQSAGTAAAAAVENSVTDIRMIDVPHLQRILCENGLVLDPKGHSSFYIQE
ncbi:MAG: FAD-dependent oxidoreductase [Spirochaetes bacterium]|nr:FAD-dependent oxidoreductase [Spirochaetota bacterium]